MSSQGSSLNIGARSGATKADQGPSGASGAGTGRVAIEDPVAVGGTLVARWSAAGVALADSAAIGPQYQAAMAVDGSGQLLGSTSGHGHVDLVRRGQGAGAGAYAVRVDLDDPDYVDSGVAATSAGDATRNSRSPPGGVPV